MSVILISC